MQVVVNKHADVLRELQLDSVIGVANFSGELIQPGRQEVLRVRAGHNGDRVTLYIKRIWKARTNMDTLVALIARGRIQSRARREWENYLSLRNTPIMTAHPVAFGEDCGVVNERFSFIITEAAPGEPLDQFLVQCADANERSQVLASLGRWVRQMHDAGVGFPDLYGRHIFVRREVGGPSFSLIDVARLDRRRRISEYIRARDLAALNVSIPLRQVSRRERWLVFNSYGGCSARRLRTLIAKRMKRLLRKPQFANFIAMSGMHSLVCPI